MNQPNQVNKVDNPFAVPSATNKPAGNNAVAVSDSEKAVQEVQAAMVIAKKFPRDPQKSMDRIINACSRPTLADSALYQYSRGGTDISGPSIRLAEALAQNWGNFDFGIRELSVDHDLHVSTVESFAWDVETNTKSKKVFQVPHARYSKARGNTLLTDPRDIYELIANNGARRLRNCILALIPGDVVETAVSQCIETQKANIDITPETIKKMLDAFHNEFGVTKEMIEERIQRRTDTITPALMLNLKRIFQSMRDGMSKPAEWFNVPDDAETLQPKASNVGKTAKKHEAPKTNDVPPVDDGEDAQQEQQPADPNANLFS